MRFLHTMIRVMDLEKSVAFYTQGLGLELISRKDYPEGRFTLAFLGVAGQPQGGEVELTHNWDQREPYTSGNGFGHLAFGVQDIHATCAHLEKLGADVYRKPGPMKHGTTVIAFVRDPDGYAVELIERKG